MNEGHVTCAMLMVHVSTSRQLRPKKSKSRNLPISDPIQSDRPYPLANADILPSQSTPVPTLAACTSPIRDSACTCPKTMHVVAS